MPGLEVCPEHGRGNSQPDVIASLNASYQLISTLQYIWLSWHNDVP